MYCNKCGVEIIDDSTFCNKCGHKIEQLNAKSLNENNEESDKLYTEEKEEKNKTKSSNKKNIIWIICSILLAGIFLLIFIINDNYQTNKQDQMNELRSNIIKQYNTLGISKTVQDYMNMSKDELQEELVRVSKQVEEFIELNEKYENIISTVDYIDYKFKLGDMGYQKINYSTGKAVAVIPKKVIKINKIFHINTLTEKVDTIWCIVEFSYDYTDGIKLRAGTNTLIGNLKIDVETENVTVYSPLDFDNGVVTYSNLYMPAENHIIAIKNTAQNYVIYPYKFYNRETVQIVFGKQLSENKQSNNETNKNDNSNNEANSDNNIENTTTSNNDYSYNDATDSTNKTEREDLMESLEFHELRGWISSEKRKELEKCSDTELKERLDKIYKNIGIQEEYNNKYAEQLKEIFSKKINVELNNSEDNYYIYTPSNKIQPKARVEYVAINEQGISAIYYSVEMTLTITDTYKRQHTTEEITTKKYYKVTNIHELDNIIKINNYDTQLTQDEINNAINATIEERIHTYHSSGLPYYFYNTGKYVLYYLSDEDRDIL